MMNLQNQAMARGVKHQHRNRSKQNYNSGAVFVEFVITMLFLIPLVFATIKFSHAISEYKLIVNQTRAAARYLVTQAPGDKLQRTYAVCLLKTSTLDCSNAFLLAGFKDSNVAISIADSSDDATLKGVSTSTNNATLINLLKVQVTGYQYSLNLIFGPKSWGTITFPPISIVMRQIS